MAIKTLAGSVCTTVFVGVLETLFPFEQAIISNPYFSALTGAAIIAVASGIMFYVDSSSGGGYYRFDHQKILWHSYWQGTADYRFFDRSDRWRIIRANDTDKLVLGLAGKDLWD